MNTDSCFFCCCSFYYIYINLTWVFFRHWGVRSVLSSFILFRWSVELTRLIDFDDFLTLVRFVSLWCVRVGEVDIDGVWLALRERTGLDWRVKHSFEWLVRIREACLRISFSTFFAGSVGTKAIVEWRKSGLRWAVSPCSSWLFSECFWLPGGCTCRCTANVPRRPARRRIVSRTERSNIDLF